MNANAKVIIFSAFLLVVSILIVHVRFLEDRYQTAVREVHPQDCYWKTVWRDNKTQALEAIRKENVKTMLRAYSAGMRDGAGQANGGLVRYVLKPRLDPPDFKPDLEQEEPK